jgi:hypothetical protein
MRRGYRVASLRTIAEHQARERRARMLHRLAWAGIIGGAIVILLLPCNRAAGLPC